MGDKSKLKIGTYQNPNSGRSKESIDKYVRGMREKKYGGKKINTDRIRKFKTGMTPGQAKIAAKAPPPNKIDEKDFAVLRDEKAKGRGMGLQDEKVQPGKVMKANLGILAMKKAKDKGAKGAEFLSPLAMLKRLSGKKMGGVAKYRTGKSIKVKDDASFSKKMELQDKGVIDKKTGVGREKITKAVKATRLGKIILPVAMAGVAAQQYLKGKMKKDKNKKTLKDFREQKKPGVPSEKTKTINSALNKLDKKMGGGMMKKYSSGGESTYTKGYEGRKTGKGVRESLKDKVTPMKKERLLEGLKASGKMGGGMMQKPMGYKIGTGKKPLETAMNKKRAEQTKNVKRLTTESDAYNPERRILHASKKTRSGSTNAIRTTTDQVNLKEARNKFRSELPRGFNVRIKTPEEMSPRRSIGRYSKGVSVKARGCKLGRTRPTRIT